MKRAERIAHARVLYARRKHFGPLPADAPDRPEFEPDEETAVCTCGRTVVRHGVRNHLRGAAHIAGVYRVTIRQVAHGVAGIGSVSRAERRAGQ